jgi:hypothetical protein
MMTCNNNFQLSHVANQVYFKIKENEIENQNLFDDDNLLEIVDCVNKELTLIIFFIQSNLEEIEKNLKKGTPYECDYKFALDLIVYASRPQNNLFHQYISFWKWLLTYTSQNKNASFFITFNTLRHILIEHMTPPPNIFIRNSSDSIRLIETQGEQYDMKEVLILLTNDAEHPQQQYQTTQFILSQLQSLLSDDETTLQFMKKFNSLCWSIMAISTCMMIESPINKRFHLDFVKILKKLIAKVKNKPKQIVMTCNLMILIECYHQLFLKGSYYWKFIKTVNGKLIDLCRESNYPDSQITAIVVFFRLFTKNKKTLRISKVKYLINNQYKQMNKHLDLDDRVILETKTKECIEMVTPDEDTRNQLNELLSQVILCKS